MFVKENPDRNTYMELYIYIYIYGISRGKVKKWKIPEGISKKYVLNPPVCLFSGIAQWRKFGRQMSFERLKYVHVSHLEKRSNKQRVNEWKLEGPISDWSNDNSVKIVSQEKNESKNLVNATYDCDLAMCNNSKCKEEKT